MKTLYFTLLIITGLIAIVYFSKEAGQYQPFVETSLITLCTVWFGVGGIELYKKINTNYGTKKEKKG